MVIFYAKNLNHHWTADEIPGTKYGLSEKGWITSELFEGWLFEHFLEHAVSCRPLLLLLDRHSTHYQPEVIRLARQNGVIMLCLPPHTTHETQPLDCGVFAPLKAHWTTVCHDFFKKIPGKVVTKFNFNFLFSKAWFQALILWGYQPPHEAPARETRKGSTQAKNNKNIVVNHETFTLVKACHTIGKRR